MTDREKSSASDHDQRRQLLDDDPPPIQRGRRRPIMLIASAAILFVLILVVLLKIDSEYEQRADVDDPFITELITPRSLDRDDRADDSFDIRRGFQPQLARGGWIQIAGDDGRLSQQYRCDRLDPLPDGWLEMLNPEMEIYLSRNRILTLRGDFSVAHAPNNAIDSGTVTGNVIVKLYEAPEGQPIDVRSDEPAMTVETDEASFDNFLGEVRCDDWVTITTPQLELPGRQLSLLHDDQNNRFQLRIQHFDYIRLFDDTAMAQAETSNRHDVKTSGNSARLVANDHAPHVQPASVTRIESRPVPRAAKADDDATFYLLTLRENVRIDQGEIESRRIAVGNQMELIFSTESEGLQQGQTHGGAGVPPARTVDASRARPIHHTHGPLPRSTYETLAMLSLGTFARAEDDIEHLMGRGITLVRGEGPLTIIPLEAADPRKPDDPRDTFVELVGNPVVLCDLSGDSEARGEKFTYITTNKQAELIGSPSHPLIVDSPELAAGGERFRFSDIDRTGGFIGPGWMVNRDRERGEKAMTGCRSLPASALAFAGSRMASPPIEPADEPELQITWEEGMDLVFDEEGGGRIREAVFKGNVRVTSDEFTLNAGEMTVGFPKDASEDTRAIETILARRDVRVVGAGSSSGDIQCQNLLLTLKRNDAGETIPTTMLATGEVQAMEDDHIIWSDSLHVTFIERRATETGSDEHSHAEPEGQRDGPHRRNVDVETLIAETDVQVLLADGTRAFADRLDGDGITETLELTGDNVFIVSDTMIMDQGRRLILDRKSGTATSPGPGQLRLYEKSVMPEQRERIHRPVVDAQQNRQELRVRWREQMTYDSRFNDGAGSVDFRGDVDAIAEPSPVERSTLTGQSLVLEFIHADHETETVADEGSEETPDDTRPLARSRRDLSLLIARRDAKLESHTWRNPERHDEPNIFYIAGQHVEYHPMVNEALVVGDGELLIHDIREDAVENASFGSKGSTTMKWSRRLHMTNPIDEVHQLVVDGEITVIHRDLDGETSWMTCERLDATIVRETGEEQLDERGGLDFGGSSRLERLKATGGVNVNTDQRDIACEEFDYDVPSGIGRATATYPRVVAMQTAGVPGVTTAQEILWNMERDTIRILRPAGAGPG